MRIALISVVYNGVKVTIGMSTFQPPTPPLIPYLYVALPSLVAYVGIYRWAREVVKKGQAVSRFKVFLAIFTLCLTAAAWVAVVVYNSYVVQLPLHKTAVMCLCILAILSYVNFFPIYTLLKRRPITYKIFVLALLPILVLYWVLFFLGVWRYFI